MQELSIDSQPVPQQLISWYYFTQTTLKGFAPIDMPQNATRVSYKPWTEAVRISSAAEIANQSLFLVNKMGILTFSPEPRIYADAFLFSNATADSIVCIENNPVFHLYRSSFFNEGGENGLPFLVHFRLDSKEFFPILSTKDLGLSAEAQSVDLFYNGNAWVAAFKTISKNTVIFEYRTFTSNESLLTMNENTRKHAIQNEVITADVYQEYARPALISDSPQRLQKLLEAIPKNISYQVLCNFPNGISPKRFIQNADTLDIYEAFVFLGSSYELAVFADGTCFFSGAMPNFPIARNGEVLAFRLPKLPSGFVYGNFVLVNNMLYIAWEETAFFETGRSGFLTIQLDKVVY